MFPGFAPEDFELFEIPAFADRMEALKRQLRPKLTTLGADLTESVSSLAGQARFAHVAKHARRTTHPPQDSWVAFGEKRGYKMGPHFQVCVWSTHVLIQWGLIYEAMRKDAFADHLTDHLRVVRAQIPDDYHWFRDHTKPQGQLQRDMTDGDFAELAARLRLNRNGEVMVGKVIAKADALAIAPGDFYDTVLTVFGHLAQLHRAVAGNG